MRNPSERAANAAAIRALRVEQDVREHLARYAEDFHLRAQMVILAREGRRALIAAERREWELLQMEAAEERRRLRDEEAVTGRQVEDRIGVEKDVERTNEAGDAVDGRGEGKGEKRKREGED